MIVGEKEMRVERQSWVGMFASKFRMMDVGSVEAHAAVSIYQLFPCYLLNEST